MKTDAEIQKDVMAELKWTPLLNATEIGVAVKSGAVTLTGILDTYSKKLAAENAAKRVSGVKAIASEIEVKLFPTSEKSDTEIARTIAESLKWHSAIKEEKIKVKVENGWVTLEGAVEWEYQKNAVENAVENLTGVRGITNLVSIKPSVTETDVKQKIKSALLRSATLDSEKIEVKIEGNKAILSGTVGSWVRKQEAQHAAWNAPGITSVENNIEIDTKVYAY